MTTKHANPSEQSAPGEAIRYPDARGLWRPQTMPIPQRLLACVFLIAALVIGYFIANKVIDEVVGGPQRAAAQVEANLARDVALDLPRLADYALLSDEDIYATLASTGLPLFDANEGDDVAAGLNLVKIPSDMTIEQAKPLYARGVGSLSALDASMLLNGSWRLTTERISGMSIRVRFCDFDSGTPQGAVQSAVAAEGLDATTLGEAGVDGSGNTFQQGTVDLGGQVFSWQVSACPLSDVYEIEGLPDTAMYVGVHLYSAPAV